MRSTRLEDIKTVVVKIGTSTISEKGLLSSKKLESIVQDIINLKKSGFNIIVVTSGAVSAGAGTLNIDRGSLTIPQRQALASVGQPLLIDAYRTEFQKYGYRVGQILLTEDDLRNRRRYLNARNTICSLLDLGVVPIINENDSVVVQEIKIGDNDTLSAHVMSLVRGELLVLLSDVDGFYEKLSDPAPLKEVFEINEKIRECSGGSCSVYGTGGMITKINAAEMVMRIGAQMVIAHGGEKNILTKILRGEERGTLFASPGQPLSSRKSWLSMRNANGCVTIDEGASCAILERKKSLLASGIISTLGEFDMGDIIEVRNKDNISLGKGITNYKSSEIEKIKGMKTSEIKNLLGFDYYEEVINRDDLIVY